MADPEVDSLVSWNLENLYHGQLRILSFCPKNIQFFFATFSRHRMLTARAKKLMKNAYLHQLALKGVKRSGIVSVTLMVHKLKNI